jgi:hypothetical protein
MPTNTSDSPGPNDPGRAGYELLQALAGYPTRSVQLGKHVVNSRVLLIERDGSGRVIGSTERIEQSEITDAVGDWLK